MNTPVGELTLEEVWIVVLFNTLAITFLAAAVILLIVLVSGRRR